MNKVDKTVEGMENVGDCLEKYLRSKEHTCPPKYWKTKGTQVDVEGPGGPAVCGKPFTKKVAVREAGICWRKENTGKAVEYKDMPTKNTIKAGKLSPTQALRNAKPAVDRRHLYSQCSRDDYWRLDCVGLISRAWRLDIMQVWTTGDIKSKASYDIPCTELAPGDCLVNSPHVMLFHSWTDSTKTKFIAWQAADYSMGHIESTETLAKLIDPKKGKNQYFCRRYNCMVPSFPAGKPACPAVEEKPAGGKKKK